MTEFWSGIFQDDDSQAVMRAAYQSYRHGLSQVIQQGVDRGEFRSVNSTEVAAMLIAAIDGLMLQWLMLPEDFGDLASAIHTVTQVTLHGLLPPPAPSPAANR